MPMSPPRWLTISESGFEWEREALAFLREHLPNHDPWQAWSNFEFVDDEGKVNEVDALVLSPRGLFLVEIKSRPGTVTGDGHSWTWTTEGRLSSADNPLLLANRKSKRLASLLKRQAPVRKAHVSVPYIEPLIFLSAVRVPPRLDAPLLSRVRLRGRPGVPDDDGVIATLSGLDQAGAPARVDAALGRIVRRAVEEAGIRPALRQRRIGEYELARLIAEGEDWQDWDGQHVGARVHRRIRLFPYSGKASDEARRSSRRLAREFEILQGIDHPGILKMLDFKDSDRGPALFFEHDPEAIRLDFLLRQHLERMTVELRFDMLRQLAETLKYAHEKRLFHRALSPQSILVSNVGKLRPRLQIMNWRTAARDGNGTSGSAAALARTAGTSHLEDYVEDPAKVYLAPEALSAETHAGPHADIFSLGVIAYHLFAGRPPADNPLELLARLRHRGGLRLSEAVGSVRASSRRIKVF
jgi:hypothetical protein